jgi:hypothetical protein
MSDTPRTDEQEYYYSNHDSCAGESLYRVIDDRDVTWDDQYSGFSVTSNFARQLERELAEAREKATTAWSDNLILDSRNRQLERELGEAREEIEMLQIRSAAASMHHAHNMDDVIKQRDTLADALKLCEKHLEKHGREKCDEESDETGWWLLCGVRTALAAAKGGDA